MEFLDKHAQDPQGVQAIAPLVQKRGPEDPTGSTPEKKVPKTWTVAEVVAWLESSSLGHLSERFRENGVDGEFLTELIVAELESELGLTRLQAKKVLGRFKMMPN